MKKHDKFKKRLRHLKEDYDDFLKIWCGCSEFDERGDLHCCKWTKLDTLNLPFSKDRTAYLLRKFVLNQSDNENPRVAK